MGTTFYDQETNKFKFLKGPLHTDLFLGDEINRATPRTQSALLEAMAEGQITVDNKTYELPKNFFVIATQNPVEQHGTFPLPEAQLDRFRVELSLGYPSRNAEKHMVKVRQDINPIDKLKALLINDDIEYLREKVKSIKVKDELIDYVLEIVSKTRKHKMIELGASPRATLALLELAKAIALIDGEDFVRPKSIYEIDQYVLGHRIALNAEKFPSKTYENTKKGINNFNIEDKFKDIPKMDFKLLQDSLNIEAKKTEEYLEKLEQNKIKEQFQIKKIQEKKEKQKKTIEYGKVLSRVVVSFLLFMILMLLLRRKKKVKKVLRDEKVMNDIKNAYRKLKRMKLSPEEEVIHKNFIKDSLKKLYFEEKEVPPPMITHDFLSTHYPQLNKVSFHFNDIFSQCFHNESGVLRKQLSIFRKSFNAILNTLIK